MDALKIRMLGNAWELENGKEYELPIDRAVKLVAMGYAVEANAVDADEEE